MSHVRAIQWLCDNVDDECDNNDDTEDDIDLHVRLSPTAVVSTSDNTTAPVVLVCKVSCNIMSYFQRLFID